MASTISSAASVISSAAANYVARTTGGVAGSNGSSNSIVQEATETPNQTAKEAASGDKVAVAKLAKEQAAAEAQHGSTSTPTSVSEPGKGEQIDHIA
jgi:hypothetical protein